MSSKRLEMMDDRRKERGSALILTLLISSILIIISGGLLAITVNEGTHTARSVRSQSAIHLAEAGAEYAIWAMNFGGGITPGSGIWSEGNPTAAYNVAFQTADGDTVGEYDIFVTDPGTSSVTVESVGYVPSKAEAKAQRTVQVGLVNSADDMFTMAAYGIESLTFGENASTDSFNSGVADYDPESPGHNGDIGTSSTAAAAVTLGNDAYIDGDGFVGVSGNPETVMPYDETYYSGSKSAQETAYNPPSVDVPALTDQGSMSLDGMGTLSDSGKYTSITLEQGSVLTVDQNVEIHVTEELYLKKDSRIDIAEGASLKVYIDDGLKINKDSQINNISHDPTKLIIYATDNYSEDVPEGEDTGGLQLKKDTVFYGAIYAPNNTVTIQEDSRIYGAVVGKNVNIGQDTKVHFDEALLGSGGGGTGNYAISYWQEK